MSEHKEPIPSMIYNASVGGHVTNSQQIIDENENKEQSQINSEVKETLGQGGSVDTRINQAKTDIIGGASSSGNTLKKIEDRVSPLESAVGAGGSVDSRIAAAKAEIKGSATSACDTLGEAEIKINANTSAINTESSRAQAAESNLQQLYEALTQSDIEIVNAVPASGVAKKIYRVVGETSYSDYMFNSSDLNTPIKMAEYDNAIDDVPTAESNNLVKSGGVYANIPPKDFLVSVTVGVRYVFNGNSCTITFVRYNTGYNVGYIDFNKEVSERFLYGDAGHDDNGKLVYQLSDFQYLVGRLQGAIGTNYTLTVVNYNQLEKTDILIANIAYGKIYGNIANALWKEEVNNGISELNNGISELNNGIETNKAISINEIMDLDGWYLTPYIDVNGLEGVIYAAMKNQTSAPYATLTCYDANKEYIADLWWTAGEIRTVMFENANVKYIRCSMNLERIAETYIARLDNTILWSPWQYDIASIPPKDFVTIIQQGVSYSFNDSDCTITIGYAGQYTVGYVNFDISSTKERYIFGSQEYASPGNKLVYTLHAYQFLVARLQGEIGTNYTLAIVSGTELKKTDIMIAYTAYGKIYGVVNEMSMMENVVKLEDNVLVPSYYDNYLKTIESKIENKILALGERNDALFFFTDTHDWKNAGNAGRLIGELMRRTNINKAVFGGDIAPAYGDRDDLLQTMKDFTERYYRFISPYGKLYSVQGNHDFTIRTSAEEATGLTLPISAIRNFFMSRQSDEAALHYDENNPESIYFYMDNQSQKIRFIFINTTDSISGTANPWGVLSTFSKPQSDWCYNAINSAPNGYSILVIGHIPACETSAPAIQTLADFLGGFKNKQSVTVNNTTYNFTNVGSELICMIAGHEHRDDYVLYKNVPYFITTCDAGYGVTAGQFTELADYPARTYGTIYEQTFDSVFIDIENKLIDYIRIGGGYDRRCHFDVKKVGIGSSIQLQTSIQNAEWLACDGTGNHYQYIPGQGDVYENVLTKISINNGTVTGLIAGNAVVAARNRTTLQLEVFCIEVI